MDVHVAEAHSSQRWEGYKKLRETPINLYFMKYN